MSQSIQLNNNFITYQDRNCLQIIIIFFIYVFIFEYFILFHQEVHKKNVIFMNFEQSINYQIL